MAGRTKTVEAKCYRDAEQTAKVGGVPVDRGDIVTGCDGCECRGKGDCGGGRANLTRFCNPITGELGPWQVEWCDGRVSK